MAIADKRSKKARARATAKGRTDVDGKSNAVTSPGVVIVTDGQLLALALMRGPAGRK